MTIGGGSPDRNLLWFSLGGWEYTATVLGIYLLTVGTTLRQVTGLIIRITKYKITTMAVFTNVALVTASVCLKRISQ